MKNLQEVISLIQKRSAEIDAKNEMPEEVLKALFENGLMSALASKDFGLESYSKASLIAEELAKVSAGVAHVTVVHNMAVDALRLFGSEDQKEYMKRLVESDVGTIAITEPSGGSDVASMKTVAEKVEGGYLINGRKTLITNAAFAKIFIVFAKVDGKITAFIVDRDDGITTRKLNPSGFRGSGLSSVEFKDVFVSEDSILGGTGKGMKVALATLAVNRIPFSAIGLGIAKRCFELAVKYAKGRDAFGKKLMDFQGMQWMLADIFADIEALDKLIKYSAMVADGEIEGSTTVLGAVCKLKAAEVAKRCADVAIEVYGGHGVMSGSPVERAYRDAKILDIAEGTSEIMKVILSRSF
ncbi:Acyl-CoA dehydrogenase [Archaeoglobus sulfaticallidus PM70-1]|uniref:Acyl-CoA dehydrogenase n=1 Tax=Archaeoglobus sulfaticallidus PM70-1 TaxID=387631 RepID=N0BNF0_9EURY|nr:acyl-CoA dehydrogenase family protein [Archaeoglobus sulfaticallidus]AGK61840.1 Acyl-CoA dehydrogenase [Archaeoglobus sulfaticallidus PM70-1]